MDQSDDGSPVSKSNNKQLAIVILDKTYMINMPKAIECSYIASCS